jgi:hypothetical protein
MSKKIASGMYKTKARNLTDAQLKRAKGAKAATKRTVSIGNTTRATTGANKGFTLGPGGKRLTGTVIMSNGDRAVYKGGKRVTNVPKSSIKKAPSKPRNTGTTTSTKPKPNATLSAAQKAKLIKDKKIAAGMGTKSLSAAQAKFLGSEGPRASKNVPVTMSPTGARPSGKPRNETTRVTRGSDGYVYYQRRVNFWKGLK